MGECVWDELVAQRRAASFLRRAVETDSVSHAYLFVGPTGSGKKTAARALACALFCDDGGCGACSTCRRARSGAHPDVHVITPEGAASAYLVDQVRDVVHDVSLKPIEASHKVYIFEGGRFNDSAANAFLKTLEEPPADVVIVLLAADLDDVLPTIASRCQVVRFAPIPEPMARALVVERTGASEEEARSALAAAGQVIPRAIDFLRSAGRRNARSTIMSILKRLTVMDGHDVIKAARELLTAVRAPLEETKGVQAEEAEAAREYLSRSVTKQMEQRHKRELTAAERDGIAEILSVTESWVRDCLVMAEGMPEYVNNVDAADATAEVAQVISVPAALRALECVHTARERIAYNVSPQLVVEAMLFDIQEVLKCPR